jgi:hypothetical protein
MQATAKYDCDDADVQDAGLQFWKRNRERYHYLYPVFLQNRSLRPSSAQLESRFSIASRIVSSDRESMSASLHSKLLRVKTASLSLADVKEIVKSKIKDPGGQPKVNEVVDLDVN